MLSIIGALNILPAFIYMNPMATSVYIQSLANIFRQTETILTLLFPSVIGFIVVILVTVRVLQFLVWMFCLFVRLICSRWTELARRWVMWRIRPIRFNFVCLPAAGKFQLQQLDHCLHFSRIPHWISRRSQVPTMQCAKQICIEPFT